MPWEEKMQTIPQDLKATKVLNYTINWQKQTEQRKVCVLINAIKNGFKLQIVKSVIKNNP